MTSRLVRVAVLSDIHAAIPDESGFINSYASTSPNTEAATRDAILSLEEFIKSNDLKAELIICCGDMADRANPTALNYVWDKFHRIASCLGAAPIATVGNHDIDSRHSESDYDSRGILRGLSPAYPIVGMSKNHEFWSRNFTILNPIDGVRVVVLNSCAYHGVNPNPQAPEYLHGRVSDFTLEDLRKALESEGEEKHSINIFVCHHHPHKHQDIEENDYSAMIGGEKLIDLLRESNSDWIILHGHKHHPRLIRGAGGTRAPLIFGAGSLSAKLHADFQGSARNQFYLMEFDLGVAGELELDMVGVIRAWDFKLGKGWGRAKSDSGLSSETGFGYALAQPNKEARIISTLVEQGGGISKWSDVLSNLPYLRYMLPDDMNVLEVKLRDKNVEITYDQFGFPIELGSSQ